MEAQRKVHGIRRNLVVAATGTGKTVVSAFDYMRYCQANPGKLNRLLFIAHREEILEQSMQKFRAILHDQNFGDVFASGKVPGSIDHLFMSIQSFNSRNFSSLPSDYYDFIIVDEVHHGCAASYQEVLTHFNPDILLGLTATPERMDGLDIKNYFCNRISCEIRLPEAINRGLLSPFQYYAITDPVSIESVKFSRHGFDETELTRRYVGNTKRVGYVLKALNKYQPDRASIKCIGFCVSKEHAHYMAEIFNKVGRKSIALLSDTPKDIRENAREDLKNGKLQYIFTVDLYNEGVDIPSVNTELMLRPTESKTVFIQQLGRGLRRYPGKSELIVLDFVGQFDKKYRGYEEKLRVLTSVSEMSVIDQLNNGFDSLPLGCHIELEKVAREYILKGLESNKTDLKGIERMIMEYAGESRETLTLSRFIHRFNVKPYNIYHTGKTFHNLCVLAGVREGSIPNGELTPAAFQRICDINSRKWIDALLRMLRTEDHSGERDELYATMLFYTLNQNANTEKYYDVWTFMNELRNEGEHHSELIEVLEYNKEKIDFVDEPVDLGYTHALDLYCSYTRDQILAGLGKSTFSKAHSWREGVLYIKDSKVPTDVFLINLNKEETNYSPTTMYEDYPISEELFHWQTQSKTGPDDKDGIRYRMQNELGTNTLLFVREKKKSKSHTLPYVFLGKASFQSYEGSRPMSIVWKMEKPIPSKVMSWSMLDKG